MWATGSTQGSVHEVKTKEQRKERAAAAMQMEKAADRREPGSQGQGAEDCRPVCKGLGNVQLELCLFPKSPLTQP